MVERPQKILIVEPDPDLLEILVGGLSTRFDTHVTCVAGVEACLDVEMLDPHDLVILEMDVRDDAEQLPCGLLGRDASPVAVSDSDGLQLAEQLMALSSRPVILLADQPTRGQVVDALRMGIRDLLTKPFPLEQLVDTAERLLRGFALRRQHLAKYHHMRRLVRRVIRERRELNQRIDLICRDLVGAHRRLVDRVLAPDNHRRAPRP